MLPSSASRKDAPATSRLILGPGAPVLAKTFVTSRRIDRTCGEKMTIDLVREKFGHLPYMTYGQAKKLQEFLTERNLANYLELGFYHGKSSAFIASILKEHGRGHLTTIDKVEAKNLSPNIGEILSELNISDWVTYYYEPRSYTWRLMKMLEEDLRPRFDFCYINEGHSWDVSGFGFLMLSRAVGCFLTIWTGHSRL